MGRYKQEGSRRSENREGRKLSIGREREKKRENRHARQTDRQEGRIE